MGTIRYFLLSQIEVFASDAAKAPHTNLWQPFEQIFRRGSKRRMIPDGVQPCQFSDFVSRSEFSIH